MAIRSARYLAVAVLLSLAPVQATLAQAQSGIGYVTQVNTGWGNDVFSVTVNSTFANPAGCPNTDAYLASVDQAGYKTYYAAALAAFMTSSRISVTVSNTVCNQGRPEIVGISVMSS